MRSPAGHLAIRVSRRQLNLFSAFAWALFFAILFATLPLRAQNINVETPFHTFGDGYYENFGVNFGFAVPGGRGNGTRVVGLSPQGQLLPNVVFSQGGSFGVIPPFGGFDPNSGGRLGINNVDGNGGGFSLGFNFAKGSTRSSSMTAPSLTVQNGFGGSMFHGQISPFVTGVIPIVGDAGPRPIDNAVTRAIESGQLDLSRPAPSEPTPPSGTITFDDPDSSAVRGDLSVAEIKAIREREAVLKRQQLQDALAAAEKLVASGDLAEARSKFREALQLTEDPAVQRSIKSRIKSTRQERLND